MSCVTCHVSPVICDMSQVIFFCCKQEEEEWAQCTRDSMSPVCGISRDNIFSFSFLHHLLKSYKDCFIVGRALNNAPQIEIPNTKANV